VLESVVRRVRLDQRDHEDATEELRLSEQLDRREHRDFQVLEVFRDRREALEWKVVEV